MLYKKNRMRHVFKMSLPFFMFHFCLCVVPLKEQTCTDIPLVIGARGGATAQHFSVQDLTESNLSPCNTIMLRGYACHTSCTGCMCVRACAVTSESWGNNSEHKTSAPPVQRLCHAVDFIAKSAHVHGVLCVHTVLEVLDTVSSWTPCALHVLRNFLIEIPLSIRSEIPSTSFKFCLLNLSAWLPAQYPGERVKQFSAPSPVRGCESHVVSCLDTETLRQNGSVVSQVLVAQRRDFGQ